MNWFNFAFGDMRWLRSSDTNKTKNSLCQTVVLNRGSYQEEIRNYKCGFLDLIKLIRNESKLLAGGSHKVLWFIRSANSQDYTVCFAVIKADVYKSLPDGISLLLPETWLMYAKLIPEQLYRIGGNKPYWAFLHKDGDLNITSIAGLMVDPRNFLDALGVTSQQEAIVLDREQLLISEEVTVKPRMLLGLFHYQANNRLPSLNWKKLSAIGVAAVACYMAIISSWASWREYQLEQDVTQLRSEANAVFQRQEQLETQLELVESYKSFLDKYPSQTEIIHTFVKDLGDIATLENIQIRGALVQLTGQTASATEVLAKFSASPHWAEVRFDRQVQRRKEIDYFTISMVFRPESIIEEVSK
ncbi:hypothetical protein K0I73_12260 [Shewanella mesophila]|uniref:hypothetical protein n=1 Tax=Shewanella mesophila TaxID=2864208 RepID=UPI001C65B266|nr:hypothetical protein [Shewanella mesophila]QYJ85001.1 hypothetical protein K0I73_12260 [Shewanella mesophila]